MKILGLGMPELLIILAVALLIFGPKHLPKLGAALGSTVKNLRDGLGSDSKEEDIEEIVEDDEEPVVRKTTKALQAETEEAPKKTTSKTTKKSKAATK